MISKRFATIALVAIALHAAGIPAVHASLKPDPDDGGLILPPGFRAFIAADNLIKGRSDKKGNNLRFLAAAPDGILYAKTSVGGLLALRDTDGDGRFDEVKEFGSGGGTGIALHDGWLYHSTSTTVYRYPRHQGDFVPEGDPEVIVEGLPDRGAHNSKSFAFDGDGRLLVEIGSYYNVYSEPDRQFGAKGMDATEFLKHFGGFWRFDANKQRQTQDDGYHFSTGHRHVLALAWQPDAHDFYCVMMGRDQMNTVAPEYYDALDNAERVSEEMHRLTDGVNLGWPYTYWDPIKKARMVMPEFGGDNRKRSDNPAYDKPVIGFPAHWAPLQMKFYYGAQFPSHFQGGAFIAFHGSWNRAPLPQDGYNVCFVPFDRAGNPLGNYEVFAANRGPDRFRMGGVAVAPDGSLYISETDRGRIWRIIYAPEAGEGMAPKYAPPPAVVSEGTASAASTTAIGRGRSAFELFCATCHMADGSGAGRLQPALINDPIAGGDAGRLIEMVLRGPAQVLPADRQKFENVMPAFPFLEDGQLADLLTYLRQAFGNQASAVSPDDVAKVRERIK